MHYVLHKDVINKIQVREQCFFTKGLTLKNLGKATTHMLSTHLHPKVLEQIILYTEGLRTSAIRKISTWISQQIY